MRKSTDKTRIISGIISMMLMFLGNHTISLYAKPGNPCRKELAENWKLISSKDVQAEGAVISVASYHDNHWYPIRRMPATVLEILQEDGVYPNLYVGKHFLEKVPQERFLFGNIK